VKLDDLELEHIEEIFRLYDEHCEISRHWGQDSRNHSFVLEQLKKKSTFTHRIGSRWSSESKLRFIVIRSEDELIDVKFVPNMALYENSYDEAQQAAETFNEAAKVYLGIGQD